MVNAKLRSTIIHKAQFLVAASVLVLLSHAVDVVHARAPNWPALGVRAAWAALLAANAGFLAWARWPTIRVTSAVANLGTAALFLALLAVTGWSRSPLYCFTFVLAIVLPVFSGELMVPALVASALLLLGAGGMLVYDRVPVGDQIGWYHAGVAAFAVSWLLAVADLRVRRHAESLSIAREEDLLRLAKSERLAAVGRLASEVAHEVSNPLAAARSNADFLRDGPDETEAEAAWDDLGSSLERIAVLVRKLQLQRDTAPVHGGNPAAMKERPASSPPAGLGSRCHSGKTASRPQG
ncbi:MAG TPA: histidine kinase dimerization/phospho-acceptor domain-containing protein [Anaeromyxobacteraceae bacterium]|nr:histidine kinase dimerization/phospho-acceptor domain-containing protein [Anaeromyxobacteraceae bacterium]